MVLPGHSTRLRYDNLLHAPYHYDQHISIHFHDKCDIWLMAFMCRRSEAVSSISSKVFWHKHGLNWIGSIIITFLCVPDIFYLPLSLLACTATVDNCTYVTNDSLMNSLCKTIWEESIFNHLRDNMYSHMDCPNSRVATLPALWLSPQPVCESGSLHLKLLPVTRGWVGVSSRLSGSPHNNNGDHRDLALLQWEKND